MQESSQVWKLKTEYVVQHMLHGRELCKEYVRDYFDDSNMYLAFLFSENMDVNYYTTYFLPILRKEKKISKFVIVSPYIEVKNMVEQSAQVPYTFILCEEEDTRDIGTYFLQGMGQGFERAIINASCCKYEKKIYEVIGYKGITAEEIVALAVYGYKEVPSREEVEAAARLYIPLKKSIDWSCYDFEQKWISNSTLTIEENTIPFVEELIHSQKVSKEDKLIIFSVTKTSKVIINRLCDYNIVAILDNNRALCGTVFEEIPVYTPNEYLMDKNPDDYKIIVPTKSYRSICEQLDEMGYLLNEQVFVTYRANILGVAQQLAKKMEVGERTYDSIREKYPDMKIYLAPYPGTGDMYLIGLYLRERMKYDNISECIVVVSSPGCKKILSLFELDDVVREIIVLKDKEESELLLYFAQGYGYDKANLTVLNDGYGMLHMQPLRGLRGLDFNTMFQKVVFFAPDRITYHDIRRETADDIFKENNLRKGRTILLSPYANTITKMSSDIWVQIAKELMDRGYNVCTNVSGDEKPIEGTLGLFIPYTKIVDFLDKAGGFIAFRSGLCDVVSGSTAKKVILYPSEKIFYNTTNYDYFSLKLMGLAEENLQEIVLDEETQKEILSGVLMQFDKIQGRD